MKKYFIFLICVSYCVFTQAQISKEKAFDMVKSSVLKNNTENIHLYISKVKLPANHSVKTMYKEIKTPNFSSWMFFIDDAPFQSWSHPARFVFVGENGQMEIKSYNYPPSLGDMDILIEKRIFIPDNKTFQPVQLRVSQITPKNISTTQNEYAVIISGGYDRFNNYERYWNDCAAIYSTLINVYNYDRTHIYVLIADGTNPAVDRRRLNGTYDSSPLDLDGDGVADIQFAATRANITTVFDTLSNTLTSNDNLFIYTTDHGGRHSGQSVFMYLWDETMDDSEFATEVNKVNAKTINIVMEQCHSGGFIDDLSRNNRVIATACKADESSYAMPPNYDFNEFVFHWTSAVAGTTPNGTIVNADTNGDGLISANEAFSYARNHDTRSETPQYSSSPTNLGNEVSLSGLIPTISGPTTVCTSGRIFTLNNIDSNTPVSWTQSGYFNLTPGPAYNQVTVSAKSGLYGDAWIRATINNVTIEKNDIIANFPETVTAPLIMVGVSQPYTVEPTTYYPDVTGYSWDWAYTYNNVNLFTSGNYNAIVAFFQANNVYTLFARAINPCGTSNAPTFIYNFNVVNYSVNYSAYPNPTGNILNIEINQEAIAQAKALEQTTTSAKQLKTDPTYDIRLYDYQGNLLRQQKTKGGTVQFNVANLTNGIYYLHIYDGINEKPDMRQIVVEH